jgi:hypothetical protein
MFALPQQKFTLAAAWLPSPVLGQGYGIGQPKPVANTMAKARMLRYSPFTDMPSIESLVEHRQSKAQ